MNTQPDTTTLEGKIAVMQAWKDKKRIQTRYAHATRDEWLEIGEPGWNWFANTYRIHPDDLNPKKLRPWKPEEIPLGAHVRGPDTNDFRYLIVGVAKDRAKLMCNRADGLEYDSNQLLRGWEHSIDNGKTWLPCGVLE